MDAYVRRVFEGESPCDKCDQAIECKKYELACRAFSFYVRHGVFKDYTARNPTHHLYNIIFRDDDVALKRYLKSKGEQGELL